MLWLVPVLGNKTRAVSVSQGWLCPPWSQPVPVPSSFWNSLPRDFPKHLKAPRVYFLKPRGHRPHLACSWHSAQVPPLLENPGGSFHRLHFPGSCCHCQCQLCALQLWATERSPCCTLSCAEGSSASCCPLWWQELGPHTPQPLPDFIVVSRSQRLMSTRGSEHLAPA